MAGSALKPWHDGSLLKQKLFPVRVTGVTAVMLCVMWEYQYHLESNTANEKSQTPSAYSLSVAV